MNLFMQCAFRYIVSTDCIDPVDHMDVKQEFKYTLRGIAFLTTEKNQDVMQTLKEFPKMSPSIVSPTDFSERDDVHLAI